MAKRKWEVWAFYDAAQYPKLDEPIIKAAGRDVTDTGCGFGQRDLGWVCKSKGEALAIKAKLEKNGYQAKVHLGY
jgi:hypothetical protein